jgi:beta-phosphoglucomutase-like phosphatase (HAD superfamily)
MKLVVFDLDGTLTRTCLVDGECYAQSVMEALGIQHVNTDWSAYEHATDEGIIGQIFVERFGRPPGPREREGVKDRFIKLLTDRCAASATEFVEVLGAGLLVAQLLHEEGWAVALATGAWRRSAEFKIRQAGLPLANVPSAFAEDGPSREAIVQAAIERA